MEVSNGDLRERWRGETNNTFQAETKIYNKSLVAGNWKLRESHRRGFREISLSESSIQWLFNRLMWKSKNPGINTNRLSRFEGGKSIIVYEKMNDWGQFVAVRIKEDHGSSQFIIIPGGQAGELWQGFANWLQSVEEPAVGASKLMSSVIQNTRVPGGYRSFADVVSANQQSVSPHFRDELEFLKQEVAVIRSIVVELKASWSEFACQRQAAVAAAFSSPNRIPCDSQKTRADVFESSAGGSSGARAVHVEAVMELDPVLFDGPLGAALVNGFAAVPVAGPAAPGFSDGPPVLVRDVGPLDDILFSGSPDDPIVGPEKAIRVCGSVPMDRVVGNSLLDRAVKPLCEPPVQITPLAQVEKPFTVFEDVDEFLSGLQEGCGIPEGEVITGHSVSLTSLEPRTLEQPVVPFCNLAKAALWKRAFLKLKKRKEEEAYALWLKQSNLNALNITAVVGTDARGMDFAEDSVLDSEGVLTLLDVQSKDPAHLVSVLMPVAPLNQVTVLKPSDPIPVSLSLISQEAKLVNARLAVLKAQEHLSQEELIFKQLITPTCAKKSKKCSKTKPVVASTSTRFSPRLHLG